MDPHKADPIFPALFPYILGHRRRLQSRLPRQAGLVRWSCRRIHRPLQKSRLRQPTVNSYLYLV